MMFRRTHENAAGTGRKTVLALLSLLAASLASPAAADMGANMGMAVVPTRIIYPGEEIEPGSLNVVEVTNPNLAGDFARSVDEVTGMITNRTLLPGRTILVSSLRVPYLVKRGASVRLTFGIGNMVISASGSPLQNGSVGDVIRVRNIDSGLSVSGTVMADGTVQVMAK
ncbi:flagellar basal body P-ring formation chaperone FlgA [Neorhizobium sp. NPDC001467]|uniref:flagellar basal body P-ring formation chaperone FlgA n=1 Tax=Neorhizobium sp. NPDC001467 TaxID=3390595 RepID=UPI003D024717